MKSHRSHDPERELEEFRNLMRPPPTAEEGFTWTSALGALFIGLVMVPGALYMGLLAGEANIGPAAQWVTVILFLEVARRAQQRLKRAEIFVLFFLAGTIMAMPFSGLLWNQFYIRSEAAQAAGITVQLPHWFAPAPDSPSYAERSFFHRDWWPAVAMVVLTALFGHFKNLLLGYGLFRIVSDVEKLPFPMAPVGAQGVMALAEDVSDEGEGSRAGNWRWRIFSIGGALGLGFGFLYLGVPTITGMITGTPIFIFPVPFSDWTPQTGDFLPAVATGMSWDLGHLIVGMVLPFFAMVGSACGLLLTMMANPLLHRAGLLRSWSPGDNTVATVFHNNVDFYFSFQIGVALAIAGVGVRQFIAGLRQLALRRASRTEAPPAEGRVRAGWLLLAYVLITCAYILVSGWLIDWHRGVMAALIFFGFLYTPLISYVTARLEGIAGQVVEIPMAKEASLILSGYRGVDIWFLPLPVANYGQMTVFYRQCELTGTKISSIWKSSVVVYPVILVSSIVFASFIWGLAEVPSPIYAYANTMWELEAANRSIIYTSTSGDYSTFERAFKWEYIAAGAGLGGALFGAMSWLGAPIFLTYGIVRGLGQSMPHVIVPQLIGALIGRYWFQKRYGLQWRQYVPVVAAGFACGQGLITTLCVGLSFLSKAAIQLPF